MKIYVRDDIYEYLTIGKRDIHSGVDDDLVVKSLDQHDLEIRADERKKVCEELEKWVYNNWYYTWEKENRYDDEEDEVPIHKDLDVKSEDLRQKLTELKGE